MATSRNKRKAVPIAANVKKPKTTRTDKTAEAINGVTAGEISSVPYVDKFPRIIGSRRTMNEISAIMRKSIYGDRSDYVDLLDELLEFDGSAYACLSQRVISVASAEFTIREKEDVKEEEREKAEEIANFVKRKIANVHGFKRSLQELLWGVFWGLSAQEISWDTDHEGDFVPKALSIVHPRRLQYPIQFNWDLYISDMGVPVERQNSWGIRVQDYAGKFIVHSAGLRGGYPTRDGLGRQLCVYMALKAMALRSGSQTIERFAKPWAIAYYNTKSEENKGNPRVATTEGPNADTQKAELALQALGTGAMTYATLPDSIQLQPQENLTGSFTAELPQTIFIKYIDQQIARAVLTTDEFTIAAGVGSQAKAEVLKRNLMQMLQYDAANLADTLTRDLIHYIVKFNFPEFTHLVPSIIIQVQDAPNLEQLVLAATQAFEMGAPIDIRKLCDAWDIPITDDPKFQAQARIDPNEELKAETSKEIATEKNKIASKKAAAKPVASKSK